MNEDRKYVLYRVGAHCAWWGATLWTAALTWMNVTRPALSLPTTFQRVSGLFILLLMGVAIALGSTLARMRLAKTITEVFQAGVTVGLVEKARRLTAEEELREILRDDDEVL